MNYWYTTTAATVKTKREKLLEALQTGKWYNARQLMHKGGYYTEDSVWAMLSILQKEGKKIVKERGRTGVMEYRLGDMG